MPDFSIDRRSAIRAAATASVAVAAGAIAATGAATPASAGTTRAPDDAAIAALVGASASQTRGALNGLYPVYRVWDAALGAYPSRVDGALNIFLGPVHPGLQMHASADYWANAGATTMAQVEAALRNSASDVVRAAETQENLLIDASRFAPVDKSPATLSSLSPNDVGMRSAAVWSFAPRRTTTVGTIVTVPRGWYAIAFRVLACTPADKASGTVAWRLHAAAIDVGTRADASGESFTATMSMAGRNETLGAVHDGSLSVDGTKENMIRLTVARAGDDAADTFSKPVMSLGVRLERQ